MDAVARGPASIFLFPLVSMNKIYGQPVRVGSMPAKNISALRMIKFGFSILVALIGLALPARAWNNVGHRTVAELVWRQMDDGERQAASELLRQHPHYKQYLAADVPAGVGTDEWVFLTAAVWPDWVRPAKKGQPVKPHSVTKYDLYPHAIGFPFLRAGDTNRALLENFPIAKPNAEMALASSIATLKNPKASAPDRAVSLCWVLHLFGDLHQPLHAANRVTRDKPHGEGLGGDYLVLDVRGKPIDMHAFWDQLPGVNRSYQTITALADELAATPGLQPEAMNEYQENKTIAAWVQESFRAAVDFAYSEDHIQFAYVGKLKPKDGSKVATPAMSAAYLAGAKEIAHRRLVLAGRRAGDVIKQVW